MNIATVALYVFCAIFIVECNSYLNPVIKTWGRREPYDYRIYYEVVSKEASWNPFQTVSDSVTVPVPRPEPSWNPFESQPTQNLNASLCFA